MASRKMFQQIISIIKSFLVKIPGLKRLVYQAKFKFQITRYKLTSSERKAYDSFEIFYIAPGRIENILFSDLDRWKDRGKVLDGDWDKGTKPLTETDIFSGLKDRFINGKRWDETGLYQRVKKSISKGEVKWGCRTTGELDMRYAKLDEIFNDIKNNGYKTQDMLNDRPYTSDNNNDEINVCLDRAGHYLLYDGRHRLAMAKILNLKTIPVQVTMKHKKWEKFCLEVKTFAKQHEGLIYMPIIHPDLAKTPSQHNDERFNLIKENLALKSGELLDIGSHWGYFCHRFEDEGFKCFAVEINVINFHILQKIKKAENKKFFATEKSIFDFKEKTRFDVVLALYIFHHFLKSKDTYDKFIQFLGNLDVQVMFFGAHNYNEKQMIGSYVNYHPDEFADFILKHSCLSRKKRIGTTREGRHIYMLLGGKWGVGPS